MAPNHIYANNNLGFKRNILTSSHVLNAILNQIHSIKVEVIVPTFTMIASTNAVIFTGAMPVLVDADPETYCIDVKKIEEKITSKTRAIMPVHIYGTICNMDEVLDFAQKLEELDDIQKVYANFDIREGLMGSI